MKNSKLKKGFPFITLSIISVKNKGEKLREVA